MSLSTRKIPALDNFNHTNGVLFGNLSAQWLDELQPSSEQKIKTRMLELHARKLGLLGEASKELIADSDFASVYEAGREFAAASLMVVTIVDLCLPLTFSVAHSRAHY